jgi:hypothetical protein
LFFTTDLLALPFFLDFFVITITTAWF